MKYSNHVKITALGLVQFNFRRGKITALGLVQFNFRRGKITALGFVQFNSRRSKITASGLIQFNNINIIKCFRSGTVNDLPQPNLALSASVPVTTSKWCWIFSTTINSLFTCSNYTFLHCFSGLQVVWTH